VLCAAAAAAARYNCNLQKLYAPAGSGGIADVIWRERNEKSFAGTCCKRYRARRSREPPPR